jgi:Ca-activated chloride channel family protein
MKLVAFVCAFFLLSGSGLEQTQGLTITGIVTSESDGSPLSGVNVIEKGTSNGVVTDISGKYEIIVNDSRATLVFSYIGFTTHETVVGANRQIAVLMSADIAALQEVVVAGYDSNIERSVAGSTAGVRIRGSKSERKEKAKQGRPSSADYWNAQPGVMDYQRPPDFNTEGYAAIHENAFLDAIKNPLSTFSIDVDVASYANLRRFLNNGQKPPIDAVRIEEMINYFNYSYQQPSGEDPFAVHTEVAACPWSEGHQLVHIGLQGKSIPTDDLPPSNLVFLIDVSGSMHDANKLPLLKSAFKMLVEQMRAEDRVAIVVYAGAAGLVLPSTSGKDKATILQALNGLSAGGSTAGGAGIKLAYEVALNNFRKGGNNRVILATDGDFNVGASSNAEMERLIVKKREEGVFLTVVGFGMGNYKDDKMEILANKGNGNYAYIDNLQEARKVFVSEFGGTLFTIAKDVKLQIEFNPAKVQAYRLLGYENRLLQDEDFNDDTKDAGELGSGHAVTALYEIIPVGTNSAFIKDIDPLKYQKSDVTDLSYSSDELLTLKLRYKQPDGHKSKLITATIMDEGKDYKETSDNFRWSAAVAEFGMLLRESRFAQESSIENVLQLASGAKGEDEEGYRREFIRLVRSSRFLASAN